ncbi:MAG: glycosyltransferase family 4 protein [Gammaproteobacteria bacterium]|nr:glycosyltransferase family 4 protein [Gammaproteobacteria bacterium]MBU1654627.1 glycosyltransferase family 4 protein [Gammaproteobacteria bacterium]MBU1959957.1 glycosyltransferase family 4 protein [Gammaproteobacteria bacterium]
MVYKLRMTGHHSKILIITRNLPPLVGGMERLIWHCIDSLRQWSQVHVIGPEGCRAYLPAGVSSTTILIRPLLRFILAAASASLRMVFRFRPDWIFAGSGLTAPFALLCARLIGAKAVVYLHGLDVEASNSVYQILWAGTFRYFDKVLVNSAFTRSLAEGVGVRPDRITMLHPGVALPDFSQADTIRAAFRQRHSLGDGPLMVFVGRITERKGLASFVEHVMPHIIRCVPNAKLCVIGDEPRLAVHRSTGQMRRIESALKDSGLAQHIHFLGERGFDDPELSEAYFAADVHIFPVQRRDHDNEGFGMVAIEAAAHGLPTVAYAVGGVTDAIAEGVSGHLVPPGDLDGFAAKVVSLLLSPPSSEYRNGCRTFASGFAWPGFADRLQEVLQSADKT